MESVRGWKEGLMTRQEDGVHREPIKMKLFKKKTKEEKKEVRKTRKHPYHEVDVLRYGKWVVSNDTGSEKLKGTNAKCEREKESICKSESNKEWDASLLTELSAFLQEIVKKVPKPRIS